MATEREDGGLRQGTWTDRRPPRCITRSRRTGPPGQAIFDVKTMDRVLEESLSTLTAYLWLRSRSRRSAQTNPGLACRARFRCREWTYQAATPGASRVLTIARHGFIWWDGCGSGGCIFSSSSLASARTSP